MDTRKQRLLKLIDEIPERQIPELINFIGYLKIKNQSNILQEFEDASKSSMGFWNNEIDDEMWNDV